MKYYIGPPLQIDDNDEFITMLQKHILEDHWRKVPFLHFKICCNLLNVFLPTFFSCQGVTELPIIFIL